MYEPLIGNIFKKIINNNKTSSDFCVDQFSKRGKVGGGQDGVRGLHFAK